MKKNFTRITTLIIILLPFFFVYFSFKNSTDCSQLVIDTYELHSDIDIPNVDFVNCYYDEKLKTRISVYNLVQNIELNKFELFKNPSTSELLQGLNLLDETERPNNSDLYLATGEKYGTKWTYLVDKENGKLWAELKYDFEDKLEK